MSEVAFHSISKRFDEAAVVSQLDLRAQDGSFVVLLGPSGCGKTTSLRMLAGLEMPTSGTITIGERDVTRLQPKDRDVAMVFQSYALYPHMTVAENIGYPLKIRRQPREERVKRVAEALDVHELLSRKPRQLSGGQRQRVALARAIVREPACFLMDEPLSNLDAKLRTSARAAIKHLQRELGTTTLYVTHDQTEALTMADAIGVMHGGVLQQHASPQEIYERPANEFVATFVGSPALSVLDAALDRDRRTLVVAGARVPADTRVYDACAAAQVVACGVRPEDFALVAPDAEDALRGEVFVVEPLGSETLVGVQLGDRRVTVKTEHGWRAPIGAPVGVTFDARAASFFDAARTTVVHRSDRAASPSAVSSIE